MFSSLKIGLVLVMMAGAGGGYLYINKLQKDNATLKSNQIKLESAVEDQKAKLQKDKQELEKRLGKHNIGNLSENKPGLVERIINGASKSAARCVEIASGSPLTEEELNGTPNRECPSFWPTP